MHRLNGSFFMFCILALCGACSTYTTASNEKSTQPLRYDASVSGLLRYSSHVATLSGESYERELSDVTGAYNESQSKAGSSDDFQTLRMAIALMNSNADNARERYQRAEALLVDHLDASSLGYFDKKYRSLAQFLLAINREWQSINNELIVVRVEKARIEEQIEQLKSIEMEMNSPGNNFH